MTSSSMMGVATLELGGLLVPGASVVIEEAMVVIKEAPVVMGAVAVEVGGAGAEVVEVGGTGSTGPGELIVGEMVLMAAGEMGSTTLGMGAPSET